MKWFLVCFLTLMMVGCAKPAPEPVPPQPEPVAPPAAPPVEAPAGQALYFADRQFLGLVPEPRVVQPGDGGLPTAVVAGLLAGPADPYLRPTFPQGARLLEPVTVAGGLARVNLSGEVRSLHGSSESSAMVDSLLFSLTDLEGIERVQILVDGMPGAVVGNYQFDEPMGRGPVREAYWVDPERVAWLQQRAEQGQERWRLDPLQTLVWEGRALGFLPEVLQGAKLEQQVDRALAMLTHQGKRYVVELGRNPGERGIWFLKAVTVQ